VELLEDDLLALGVPASTWLCGSLMSQQYDANGAAAIDPITFEVLPWDPNFNTDAFTIYDLLAVDGKIFIAGDNLKTVNGGALTGPHHSQRATDRSACNEQRLGR